jgi:hypothetical protein
MSLLSKFVSSVLLVNGFAMAGNGLLLGAGLNLSDISTSEDLSEYKESMRTGFNLGAGFEIGITPMFSIVPGVSLETRGKRLEFSDPDVGDLEAEANFMYLEVPVLAQVNIPAGPGSLNIFAGPEMGILLSAKMKMSGTMEGFPIDADEDMKDQTKALDFGIHIGLGFEIPVGPGAIAIRPGYSFSLTDFDDSEPDPDFPEEEESESKHTNIKLAIAYKISL